MSIRWYVSPLLIVMLVVLVMCGYFYDCVIYLTTIVLHELFHAEVSVRLGYTLDRFVLMPYGAGLKGNFEGVKPKDEIIIALAGPLFNAALGIALIALWWIYPPLYVFTDRLVYANIFTALFNLLPVFPLDGGRVLLAAMSIRQPRQKAYKKVRILGFMVAPVFAALSVAAAIVNRTPNFSFALVGGFIFVSTIFPDKNSVYRRVYGMAYFSERLKHGLKMVEIMVPATLPLIKLDRMLNTNYYTSFVVVEGEKRIGVITETQLTELMKICSPGDKVIDAIPKVRTLNADFTSYKE